MKVSTIKRVNCGGVRSNEKTTATKANEGVYIAYTDCNKKYIPSKCDIWKMYRNTFSIIFHIIRDISVLGPN